MIGSMVKTYAYGKAPKATFAVLHPRITLRVVRLKRDLRHAYAPRVAALGALAIALPLGYMIGRRNGNGGIEG